MKRIKLHNTEPVNHLLSRLPWEFTLEQRRRILVNHRGKLGCVKILSKIVDRLLDKMIKGVQNIHK